MGFQTPQFKLEDCLKYATSGRIQLPDFQRDYKWEDERIRQLLVTVLKGHPMGVIMLLRTGNEHVRFKPKPLAGVDPAEVGEPDWLLLDGQQRLTSLTQALTGDGVVDTTDSRGKRIRRRYFIDMRIALEGEERIDDAVLSLPETGIETRDFGREVALDVSTREKQFEHRLFPANLLLSSGEGLQWFFELNDNELAAPFSSTVIRTAESYTIPAIELDENTSKAAVATVFEKVNTGGLQLNVFELLTATFAGDGDYYRRYGEDFRLSDDWQKTQEIFSSHPVLADLRSTDFLQAVTLLATLKRNQEYQGGGKPPAVSAKREDILKITLEDYLEWVDPLREGFQWVANFLADRFVFDTKFLPYRTQLIPLACIRVILGPNADLLGPRERIIQWFWCGILGEHYAGQAATIFVQDVEQVPGWAMNEEGCELPSTIERASFVESRLHSLRTRRAAAYKGIYVLLLANQARDWMTDQALEKVQYKDLDVDIHHIFPRAWCNHRGIDDEHQDSIVNKTAIAARTNRTIGGEAPSKYLNRIENRAQISSEHLDAILRAHLIPAEYLRADDFEKFFAQRREWLCQLVEEAMGKVVLRDVDSGAAEEVSEQFEESAFEEETVEVS